MAQQANSSMILERLRQETQDLHDTVEAVVDRHLFQDELSPNAFYTLLCGFYKAYNRLETAAQAFPLGRELLQERAKTGRLLQDLNNLKQLYSPASSDNLTCQAFGFDSEAKMLGAWYVMEGATLGGQIIERQLQQRHPWIDPAQHLNFFNSYGEKRGSRWREFRQLIADYASQQPLQQNTIIEGARAAFQLITDEVRRASSQRGKDEYAL